MPRRAPLTIWEKIDRFPPILCRLLAKESGRHGRALGQPLTNRQLAERTGMSEFEILTLSQQLDWRGVDILTLRKFTQACGVDLENARDMKRVAVYLRGRYSAGARLVPKFLYLRKHPEWETFFAPLAAKFFKAKQNERIK